jgi:hypothetical protein
MLSVTKSLLFFLKKAVENKNGITGLTTSRIGASVDNSGGDIVFPRINSQFLESLITLMSTTLNTTLLEEMRLRHVLVPQRNSMLPLKLLS